LGHFNDYRSQFTNVCCIDADANEITNEEKLDIRIFAKNYVSAMSVVNYLSTDWIALR
jgi:hypothetical protein